MKARFLLLPLAALLGGCFNDSATLQLGASDHGLTLLARQQWFWNKKVDIEVVMMRLPDCQRRSRLDGTSLADLNVDVFMPDAGEYAEPILILKQGAQFYAVSRANCELQKFKAPPPKPGTRLGRFQREGDGIGYVDAPQPKAPAPAPAPSPPPAAQ